MSAYKHQPLQGVRSTRLIWLDPSNSLNSQLHCRIYEVSLDNPPPYEALSYSWDSQTPDKDIICFNRTLKITENCQAAMHRLRLPSRPRVLWIDSICID